MHKRVASGLGGEVTGEQTETAWAVLSEEDEEENNVTSVPDPRLQFVTKVL